jgi:hypothetical protein
MIFMTLGLCFAILIVLWIFFGFWPNSPDNHRQLGDRILLFLLFFLLGWQVFGPLLHR